MSAARNDPIWQIRTAWRELRRLTASAPLRTRIYGEGDGALDIAQADALTVVVARGPLRMAELAAALHVDASTATRTVDHLVRRGLVGRRRAPDDGRVMVVEATDLGRERQRELDRRARQVLADLLADVSDRDRRRIASGLSLLVEALSPPDQ